jgi:hypothetical protein
MAANFILYFAAEYAVAHWDGHAGYKFRGSAAPARALSPASLVQHLGATSVWGGSYHTARDFQLGWLNRGANPSPEAAVECINILDKMHLCDGWLDEAEAELLISTTKIAADRFPHDSPAAVIEGLFVSNTVVLAWLSRVTTP